MNIDNGENSAISIVALYVVKNNPESGDLVKLAESEYISRFPALLTIIQNTLKGSVVIIDKETFLRYPLDLFKGSVVIPVVEAYEELKSSWEEKEGLCVLPTLPDKALNVAKGALQLVGSDKIFFAGLMVKRLSVKNLCYQKVFIDIANTPWGVPTGSLDSRAKKPGWYRSQYQQFYLRNNEIVEDHKVAYIRQPYIAVSHYCYDSNQNQKEEINHDHSE